jgi:copper chaperone CopZ
MKVLHLLGRSLTVAWIAVFSQLAAAQPNEDPMPVMVTISEMHICCGGCVKAIQKAASIDGVQVQVLEDDEAVTLTADGYADVQRAIDALAKAGFYGSIEDDTLVGKVQFPPIRTPKDNVKKLVVRHIHNCCNGCSEAIVAAIEGVDGVSSNTVKPKAEEFIVEGNFDAGTLVAALQEAGFYPTIE